MSDEERLARRQAGPRWNTFTGILAWCGDSEAIAATGAAVGPDWTWLGTNQAQLRVFLRGRQDHGGLPMTDPARLVACVAMTKVWWTLSEWTHVLASDWFMLDLVTRYASRSALGQPVLEAARLVQEAAARRAGGPWAMFGRAVQPGLGETVAQIMDPFVEEVCLVAAPRANQLMGVVSSEVAGWANRRDQGFLLHELDGEGPERHWAEPPLDHP